MQLIFLILLFVITVIAGQILSVLRGLGQWNRTYRRLGARYAGKQTTGGVKAGYLFGNPSLVFDYGRTYCSVKNRYSRLFPAGRHTEVTMDWPDRDLKMFLSTLPDASSPWNFKAAQQIPLKDIPFGKHFQVFSNRPAEVPRLLTGSSLWILERMRCYSFQLVLDMDRGRLRIAVPGFVREEQPLSDLIQDSLNLFDQMMLAETKGIEFLNADEAAIVENVKCPICSEPIGQSMVVCQRCKTPHCFDCWQYNGQCATFACRETRYVHVGGHAPVSN